MSAVRASSIPRFTTSGTVAVVRLTVSVMVEPCSSFVPLFGRWSRMIPPGRGLSTNTALKSKPDFCIAAAAVKTSRSTTSGTATIGACSVILAYATAPPMIRSIGAARMIAQWRAFHRRGGFATGAAGGPTVWRRTRRLGFGGLSGFTGLGDFSTLG